MTTKRKFLWALLFLTSNLLLPISSYAQNITTVTATVVDPNGIPYSNASVQAQLVPTGTNPTINGQAIAAFTQATADVAGTFSMNLGSNAVILPGGTKWQFTVDENGISVPLGTGPQSIVASITISGASQNISATLNALAPKLTNFTGGGGTPSNPSGSVQFNNAGAFGGSGNFLWGTPVAGALNLIEPSASCPTPISCTVLSLTNSAGGTTPLIFVKGSDNSFSLCNDSNSIPNHGCLTFTADGTTQLLSGANGSQMQLHTSITTAISGWAFPAGSVTFLLPDSGVGTAQFALGGPGTTGPALIWDTGTGCFSLYPASSSTTKGALCPPPSGTPNPMNFPIASATIANSYLVSDANNPQQLSWAVPGVAINAQTGASYPIASTDRSGLVTDSNTGATAIMLPQAGSAGFTNNFNFGLFNINTGLVTITPNTSSINGALSQIVPNNWGAYVYSDNTNYRAGVFPSIAAFPNCIDSAGNHVNFTSATGAFSCGTTSSGAVGYGAGAGSVNVMTVTTTPAISTNAAGTLVEVLPNLANTTTTPTLNVGGAGAMTDVKGPAQSALVASDYNTTTNAIFLSDGARWQLLNPLNAAFTSVSTGTAPCPNLVAGTSGVQCGNEGTTPTGTNTSVDMWWQNSTLHCEDALSNNVDEGCALTVGRQPIFNFNQAAQSQVVVSATEYYITRSDLDMPATYRQAIGAGTTMHWRVALTKTAAGTGTFQVLLKKGTNGSTADTSIVTQTIGTQTAAADNMEMDVSLTWTSTTAAYWTIVPHQSAPTGTGFGLVYPAAAAQFSGTISGQTTTTASDKYGLSVIFTTGTPTFVVNEVMANANGVL